MEPLVSVIIPVYNVLPYLREALDSVISQTYKNLEIIVVDDGSTDGSGEVCDEYLSDPRVIVIHQENKGLSGARNIGLNRMTGEYVAFLDSDDAFMPEMIEKMLDALIRNNANISFCGYDECLTEFSLYNSDTQKTSKYLFDKEMILSSAESLNMIMANQTCWAVWNKLYQHSIWNSIRFPEGDNYEDMRVMCQAIERCNQIVTVPGIYILYRQRLGSITKTQSEKNMQDYLAAVISIEKYAMAHCPQIISPENMYSFIERYARTLSNRYATLLYQSHSYDSIIKYRKEILLLWNQIESIHCKLQSRIIHHLFINLPWLIPPFKACWRWGKKLIGKVFFS